MARKSKVRFEAEILAHTPPTPPMHFSDASTPADNHHRAVIAITPHVMIDRTLLDRLNPTSFGDEPNRNPITSVQQVFVDPTNDRTIIRIVTRESQGDPVLDITSRLLTVLNDPARLIGSRTEVRTSV